MKANEAPKKIYMTPSFAEPNNVLLASFSKSHLNFHRDIEYIRTDAFIEKACLYIKDMVLDIAYSDVDGKDNYNIEDFIKCFRKYMNGE